MQLGYIVFAYLLMRLKKDAFTYIEEPSNYQQLNKIKQDLEIYMQNHNTFEGTKQLKLWQMYQWSDMINNRFKYNFQVIKNQYYY